MFIPLSRPTPPRLSTAGKQLAEIEQSGRFSNFGPVNQAFEQALVDEVFGGNGACVTVCNATIGLMLAIQHVIGNRPTRRRYALMPSFAFAAAAHAALWCGLTPLFCDIDRDSWAACPDAEDELLSRYGDDIAVVVAHAAFGYAIDLDRYEDIQAVYGVPTVVDATAALGTVCPGGQGFGTGFGGPVVFSMHAARVFATGEAGLVYSADPATVQTLRQMSDFGFGPQRVATMPGLNGKLTEVGALLGRLRLAELSAAVAHRDDMLRLYRTLIPELTFQPERTTPQAQQWGPALLPPGAAPHRAALVAAVGSAGVELGTYFSPHLCQQGYFIVNGVHGGLDVTDDVAGRVVSLPLSDTITPEQVTQVARALRRELYSRLGLPRVPARRRPGLGTPRADTPRPDAPRSDTPRPEAAGPGRAGMAARIRPARRSRTAKP